MSLDLDAQRKQYLPNFFDKFLAASTYIIPTLDANAITLSLFKWWASISWTWFLIEPLSIFYYSSSFIPLIIFFILFLVVVRNKRFKHIVRFHAMQVWKILNIKLSYVYELARYIYTTVIYDWKSVMVNIVINLANIIRMYLPPELRLFLLQLITLRNLIYLFLYNDFQIFRWSLFLVVFDRFLGATIIMTLLYCILHAIQGRYADIPFISNAVYVQVDLLEPLGG